MFPQERMSSLGFPHFAIKKKKTILENVSTLRELNLLFFFSSTLLSNIFSFIMLSARVKERRGPQKVFRDRKFAVVELRRLVFGI